jgi:hypothetical protein
MRASILTATAAASAGLLIGCAQSTEHRYAFELAPTTGALAVDVENFRGSVEVRADLRTDRPHVIATPHAGAALGEEQAAALAGSWVSATLEEESARAVLHVRGTSPRENTGDHWVNLVIRVPRCDGVRIRNTGGTVLVVGTRGGTEIRNHLGAVEFRTNESVTDPVTITTTDGDIYFQVSSGSSGAFDLETLDGKVYYRDRIHSTDSVYAAPGVHRATLHNGTNPVVLRTNRGDINAWVDEDAASLTRVFKHQPQDPQDFWFLQGSRRHTRNLPEDHPEITAKQATVNPYHDGY